MKDISLPTKNNSFKLNAITHLLGIMGIIPLFFAPSATALAQNCTITKHDNRYGGTSYSVSSPIDTCHISDEDARKIANLTLWLEGEGIITLNGDITLNSIIVPSDYNNNYNENGSFKLNGSATLNSHVFLSNSTISKNAKFTSDSRLNNTTIGGNLNINDSNYRGGPGSRPFLHITYTDNSKEINHTLVKGNLRLDITNVVDRYNAPGSIYHLQDPTYGSNNNAALSLGAFDSPDIAEITKHSDIRFIVEGNSHISLGKHNETNVDDKIVRSAVGTATAGWGGVIALGEKYDEKRHAIERSRNKIFFGKNSIIETKSDYSHGLLLSAHNYLNRYLNEGNQIYVENKGKIQVDGKASAISAYLYRIASEVESPQTPRNTLLKIHTFSKTVDDVEIMGIYPEKSFGSDGYFIYEKDPNLQGDRSLYIAPSLLKSKAKLAQGDNLSLISSTSAYIPNGRLNMNNTVLSLLADAKKNFDPNEKVIEIHNSGKLLAPNGYIFSGSMFKDEFHSTSGELAGKLVLNDGSDEVNLAGTDLAALTELNGAEIDGRKKELNKTVKMAYPPVLHLKTEHGTGYGRNIAPVSLYVLVDIPQAINTLNLDKDLTGSSTSNGQANDTKIVNWDIINLGKNAKAKLNLTGGLNDGWDEALAGNMDNFDKKSRKKELNIGHLGTVALVNTKKSASIKYNVTNAGTIDLTTNPITEDVLTINGDYKGENATLLVNSLWHNPDYQENDQLVIKGNASGKTTVKAPAGIKGNVTLDDKEIKNGALASPVVIVEGKDEGRFVGKAMTENAGEAQLVKTVTADGKSQYHWTLGLKNDEQEIINTPSTSYVQSQAVARELGFMTLGRLNHRLGELTNSTEPQTWLRTRIEDDSLNGKNRFAAKSQRYLVQLGQDVALWQNKDKLSRLGLTFSHSKTNTKFFDKYRSENGEVINDKFTTQSKLTALSLGGYFTQRYNNGAYIDFVGQLSHLKFNYLGEAQAKQKGYAVGASVEVGYPIALNSIWDVEPQAQLSYQHIRLSAFSDAQQRQIAKQTSNNLRARLGVRFVANKQFYLAAHLHYAFGNQSKATVGRSNLSEKYAPLTAELSLGGKFDLSPNVSVNLEAHYKKNLSNGYKAVDLQHKGSRELGGQARLQVRF